MKTVRQTPQPAAPASPTSPSQSQQQTQAQFRNDLREQIRQTVEDATAGARDAAQNSPSGPGVIIVPPRSPDFARHNDFPPEAAPVIVSFFITCAVIIVGWPLARAFGRRIDRRAETPSVNPQLTDQLQRIERAVEAMSIEVERISESQRYLAKLQNTAGSERAALGASVADERR